MKTLKTVVLLALFFVVPFLSHAQGEPPDDPVDTPIDSWLIVLIGAAVVYGGYKKWSEKTVR